MKIMLSHIYKHMNIHISSSFSVSESFFAFSSKIGPESGTSWLRASVNHVFNAVSTSVSFPVQRLFQSGFSFHSHCKQISIFLAAMLETWDCEIPKHLAMSDWEIFSSSSITPIFWERNKSVCFCFTLNFVMKGLHALWLTWKLHTHVGNLYDLSTHYVIVV